MHLSPVGPAPGLRYRLAPIVFLLVLAPGVRSQCGDCNGDGTTTILDSLVAAQHAVGIVSLHTPVVDPRYAICNATGVPGSSTTPGAVIDVVDALVIAQHAAGLPVTMVCGTAGSLHLEGGWLRAVRGFSGRSFIPQPDRLDGGNGSDGYIRLEYVTGAAPTFRTAWVLGQINTRVYVLPITSTQAHSRCYFTGGTNPDFTAPEFTATPP